MEHSNPAFRIAEELGEKYTDQLIEAAILKTLTREEQEALSAADLLEGPKQGRNKTDKYPRGTIRVFKATWDPPVVHATYLVTLDGDLVVLGPDGGALVKREYVNHNVGVQAILRQGEFERDRGPQWRLFSVGP